MTPSVLIVDDEPHICKSLSRLFSMDGFSVLTAPSADKAMEMIASHPVGVVISDYRMPGTTGLDLMIQIRNTHPEILRILLTAFSEKKILEKAINQGEIYRFFNKPWNEDELLDAVRRAMSLRQSRLSQQQQVSTALRQSNMETVMAIAEAVELKDPYTKGHCSRVKAFSIQLARAVNLSDDWFPHLVYGALLHDCGKIGIDEALLGKPGRLAESEKKIIETHSVLGFELMNSVSHLKTASLFVRQHHERWDGQGYPDGLSREQIHVCSRIISIADAYDAMTSDRPYRKGLATSKARQILIDCRGSQFDPDLVDVFVRLLENKNKEAGPKESSRPALLMVDPEKEELEAMGRLFCEESFVIHTASDSRDALAIIDRHRVDILICEADMAICPGLGLLSQAKSRVPGIMAIIISSQGKSERLMAAINETDIYKVIVTPFKEAELRNTVKNALERREISQVPSMKERI